MVDIAALLDTSIVVDALRSYAPAITWFASRGSDVFGITPYVWMEVVYGVESKARQSAAEKRLRNFVLIYPAQADLDWAMRQLAAYRLSHGVGVLDCLIAAPARRLQVPLYTTNVKHFAPLLGDVAVRPY
ncbi:MAG: PIN domain-containing protein [Anaerolineae bacterium]|nr:PIN domain-containing protein [Anaerolineae bacterium]